MINLRAMLGNDVLLESMCCMQAGVTDNVPLHVLGGNIIPVALGEQFLRTDDVRNASISLIVALPKENTTAGGEASLSPFCLSEVCVSQTLPWAR